MKIKRKIKVVIYESITDSLRSEWDSFWKSSSSANMFNSAGWFIASCKAFSYERVKIVCVYDTSINKLIALMPLVEMRLYGLKVFALPASEFIDRFLPLFDVTDDDLTDVLLGEFLKIGRVYIQGLTKDDINCISRHERHASFFPTDINPYMIFSNGYLGKYRIGRKSKSLQKAERVFGLVRSDLFTKNHSEAIQTAFDIDRKSSKYDKGKGVFWRNDAVQFFTLLSSENPECLFVELLFFGEIPIAYSIGFIHNKVYACSQKAHLTEYEQYRPGGIAFSKFIETIISDDLREVDIGRGYDSFKMDFTRTTRMLHNVFISKNEFLFFYIQNCYTLQENLYVFISNHPHMYKLYKRMKKSLSLIS